MAHQIVLDECPAENPIDELSEIEIYKTQSITDNDFCIGVVVRFNSISIACDNWAYTVLVRLKEATIQISTENSRISQDGRAGDHSRPFSIAKSHSKEEKISSQVNTGTKVGANISVGPEGFKVPSLALSANASSQNDKVNRDSESYKLISTVSSLTSMPGGRWLIADVISDTLFGKYQPDEHLCKIRIDETKMSGSATGALYFFPRDLSIEAIHTESLNLKKFIKERPEKVAVAKALIAKHLKGLNSTGQSSIDGRIVIGTSKVNFRLEEVPNGTSAPRSPVRRKR